MGMIFLAILKLAASALWVVGFYTLAKDIDKVVVSGGSGGPSGMFDIFMQIGMFGILQSIGALRGLYAWWGGSMETALNTRHFTLWKNSSGTVVAAEEDHSAPFLGCLFMLIIGGFLVVACSALISPIMFIVNVSSALILLTSWGKAKPSAIGLILSVIVGIACIGGTIYGWNYISTRMDILQGRRKAEMAERQKHYEAERAEQARIAAEKRAEEERLRAERRAEQERIRAQRKAEKEFRATERRIANEAKRAERQAERATRNMGRSTRQVPRAIRQPRSVPRQPYTPRSRPSSRRKPNTFPF